MISEAVTMMIGDILFVYTLKKSGFEYDYSARKIFPLYEKSNLDFEKDGVLNVLLKLIKANVEFCCKGNESYWREIVNDQTVFETFKTKFMPFFVEGIIFSSCI
jgi:hypothetical protein